MRVLFFFIGGAIAAFLVCKFFVLSGSELETLGAFWNNLGTEKPQNVETLVKSGAFLKLIVGMALGGFLGALFSNVFGND